MPSDLTEITEIATALGVLAPGLDVAFERRPEQLVNVGPEAWARLRRLYAGGEHANSFRSAFENGQALLRAEHGLRGRQPIRVEWKGPHRPPGDDVIPADIRIDHVFLVSCKYLSRVLSNSGPPRLFDRLLRGEGRSSLNWFLETAPGETQALYQAAVAHAGHASFPPTPAEMSRDQQRALKAAYAARAWPDPLVAPWAELCSVVAERSAQRWRAAMPTPRHALRQLWRLLRITTATYFVLGTDRATHLRLRIDSAWDWMQSYELCSFEVMPKEAGQPEVAWQAVVRHREDQRETVIDGHVEIRWSHGRFLGSPEAKVYLDSPHNSVPGYNALE